MPHSSPDVTYPVAHNLKIVFSVYEDRLVAHAERGGEHGPIALLLTRRMVMMVLRQLLNRLPELQGLDQTPAQYWQEVLQMAHQRALEAHNNQKKDDKEKREQEVKEGEAASAEDDGGNADVQKPPYAIYLATELTLQPRESELLIAFKGLPMPAAMTKASAHEPVLAMSLKIDHVHQVIQLLIDKAQEAQWHLPVDLPWLESPIPQPTSLGRSTVH